MVGITSPIPTKYKVTREQVLARIALETYTVLPSGKSMICELTLTEGGFVVVGKSIIVDKAAFDNETGMRNSKEDALKEVYVIEAHNMQRQMWMDQAALVAIEPTQLVAALGPRSGTAERVGYFGTPRNPAVGVTGITAIEAQLARDSQGTFNVAQVQDKIEREQTIAAQQAGQNLV